MGEGEGEEYLCGRGRGAAKGARAVTIDDDVTVPGQTRTRGVRPAGRKTGLDFIFDTDKLQFQNQRPRSEIVSRN